MHSRVLAFHIILTMYGFWLPNDERGSRSEKVWAKHLRRFGEATGGRADGERSVAHRSFNRARARAARRALKYPAVCLTERQAKVAAEGVARMSRREGLIFRAFAIMPDHLHCMVVAHPRWTCEQIMSRMKGAITSALLAEDLHPLAHFVREDGTIPKLFARGGRHRFLFTLDDVQGRIQYVQNNPIKSGLPPQRWTFVSPHDERRAQ